MARRGRKDIAQIQTLPTAPSAGAPAKAKGRKGKGGIGWVIAFWVALACFLGAAFFVGRTVWSYWHGSVQYEKLADDAIELPDDDSVLMLDALEVDWDYLLGINSDTIGWLFVPGTNINYPIVWCGNDRTYLTRTFDGKPGGNVTYGTLFLEGDNTPDLSDPHNVIFGHAMKNGTMFAALHRMSYNGTFNKCRDFYLLTPKGNLHLRSFAYVHVVATDLSVMTAKFKSATDLAAFIQNKMSRTMFQPDDEVPSASEMSKIFSFITCDSASSAGRYIVYCYVVESTIPGIEGYGGEDPNKPGISLDLVDGLGW